MDSTQLSQLEGLCRTLFTSADPAERARAQQSVLVLQSSVEYIPQCEYILENSSESFALLVAANSLTKLITTHWNNFTVSQRIDISMLLHDNRTSEVSCIQTVSLLTSSRQCSQETMCSTLWHKKAPHGKSLSTPPWSS